MSHDKYYIYRVSQISRLLILISCLSFLICCNAPKTDKSKIITSVQEKFSSKDSPMFEVKLKNELITIDGIGNEEVWNDLPTLESFIFPWQEKTVPATTFQAFHDQTFLYFYFTAKDDEIILKQSGDEEMDAVASDRVEIFIRSSDETKPYYSFEMDPLGRVFDSKGEFGKYIDQEYDFPSSGLEFHGVVDENGYSVEGRLELQTLHDLGLISQDNILMTGLYRGEYFTDNAGEEKTHWISWVTPDSETPNFHIPSSFGKLKIINLNKNN